MYGINQKIKITYMKYLLRFGEETESHGTDA